MTLSIPHIKRAGKYRLNIKELKRSPVGGAMFCFFKRQASLATKYPSGGI
jgi:hypothetical protein